MQIWRVITIEGSGGDFVSEVDAMAASAAFGPDTDVFMQEGVLTYQGFRFEIPRNSDGSISYHRPERHIRKSRVLQKGESVNLSQLARMQA